MTKVNRRDFLKLIGVSAAILAAPKAVLELEAPAIPLNIPDELKMALANFSMMRLDSLGITVDGLQDLPRDDWTDEVIKRYNARL